MIEFENTLKKSKEIHKELTNISKELTKEYPISFDDSYKYVFKLLNQSVPIKKIPDRAKRQIEYWIMGIVEGRVCD
jgi:hypothetical protein